MGNSAYYPPVGRQVSYSAHSKTILPPISFNSRPMDQQHVRAACYLGFSKGKSTHLLQFAARQIWPSRESLAGRT